MPLTSRQLIVFASGFVLVAMAAVGVGGLLLTDSPLVRGKPDKVDAMVATPPAMVALASGQPAPCPSEPVAVAANEKDGRFPLQANVEGLMAADITSFIAIGQESAAAGRPRDAEAAFLMACRVADKVAGAGSVESADAKYQLGAHYARLAFKGGAAASADRAELLRRAERLHADSSQVYLAGYGQAHEKSQAAIKGLAEVRQALAPAPQPSATATAMPAPIPEPSVTPAPTPAPAVVPAPAPQLATRSEETEKPPQPPQPPQTAPPVAAPAVSPVPPADARESSRQRPPGFKECLPAVATLGLCDPNT
ncbi:hypothetical protein [Polaromonas sp.]|uniref:hypothetical protein n=1 Tax=Polaromonas sp. TaxID=1869339 RepID=UPI002C82F93D|nr:hypothetical protein [Polaromonas sp.]HQS33013.1 hypothetical protein [Polaromonas sp.]HQS91915.1 hypothetical protein [Polaromonas sp.]